MKKNKINIINILLLTFFIISIFIPLFKMLSYIKNIDIINFISSKQFKLALKNSIIVSITATILSVLISSLLSISLLRTNIKFKQTITIVLTIPMLIPSISHGIGLVLLLGTNGILTNMFNLSWNIYGFWGVVVGSIMYSFPVSFLMISDILKYEDFLPYEAATILGFSNWDKFKKITFPYIKKPILTVLFATFTLIITDYGVPIIVGGKFNTLPVLMYQEVIGQLNFNRGIIIGLFLLVPALIMFIIDLFNKKQSKISFITNPFNIKPNKIRDIISYIIIFIVLFIISLPILVFIILSFIKKYPIDISFTLNNVINTFKMNGGSYLINSLIISTMVSLIGTILAYTTGYLTTRATSKFSNILHIFAISSLSIPGIVLGLSYVIAFSNSFLYGSISILILVNLVHFFTSPYLMICNTFNKINENLESISATLGISRFKMIKDILIPQSKNTIMEMLSYFFVNSMVTISAISFLSNINNKPISLLINQFEGNMMIESSAFVSLLILVINLIIKSIIQFNIKKNQSEKGFL